MVVTTEGFGRRLSKRLRQGIISDIRDNGYTPEDM